MKTRTNVANAALKAKDVNNTVFGILKKALTSLNIARTTKDPLNIKEALRSSKAAARGARIAVEKFINVSPYTNNVNKLTAINDGTKDFYANIFNLPSKVKGNEELWKDTTTQLEALCKLWSEPPFSEVAWPDELADKKPRFVWFTVKDKNGKTRAEKAAGRLGIKLRDFGYYLTGKNGFSSNVTKKFRSTFSGLSSLLNVVSGARDRRRLQEIWESTTPQGQAAMQAAAKAASNASRAAGATAAQAAAAAAEAAERVGKASGAAAAKTASLAAAAAMKNGQGSNSFLLEGGRRRSRKNRSRKNRSRKNRKASRKNRK